MSRLAFLLASARLRRSIELTRARYTPRSVYHFVAWDQRCRLYAELLAPMRATAQIPHAQRRQRALAEVVCPFVFFVETRMPDSPQWSVRPPFYLSRATAERVAADLRGIGHPFVRVRPAIAQSPDA